MILGQKDSKPMKSFEFLNLIMGGHFGNRIPTDIFINYIK